MSPGSIAFLWLQRLPAPQDQHCYAGNQEHGSSDSEDGNARRSRDRKSTLLVGVGGGDLEVLTIFNGQCLRGERHTLERVTLNIRNLHLSERNL